MDEEKLKYVLFYVMGIITGIAILGLPFVIRRSFGLT